MATCAFDTLQFVEELVSAGVPDAQAKALARAIARVLTERVAARQDVELLHSDVTRDIKEMERRLVAQIAPLRWGIAFCVGGIVALLVKGFFHV